MANDGFNWKWDEFCETGLKISTSNSTLALCFQKICLQVPVFSLIAIFSAYYCGQITNCIVRNRTQLICLNVRAVTVFLLAIISPAKLYDTIHQDVVKVWPADVLATCVEFLGWSVHFGIVVSYRKAGKLSHRGPLLLLVIWSAALSLSIVWFETSFKHNNWPWALTHMLLNITYGLTLLPSGKSQIVLRERNRERDALINSYYRLSDNENAEDVYILGAAQDGHNIFSRMFFHWVTPLIEKGVLGMLRKNDDLFDLPEFLNIKRLSDSFHTNICNTRSLFKALHKSFGFQFYAIGFLRLFSDLSSFAGPLLLGGLLRTGMDEKEKSNTAYWYAAGLFASTLISAVAGVHFNWKISIISMKMRTSLVSAIYKKGLDAKQLQDSKPEILNLMSTDTDRIVNSCISFHSFWSIPFQLFTTLYLLYTQLGVAFISGVIFAVLLIPINRYICKKIGTLSEFLMSAKDKRVQLTTEALSGAKQVKLQALEDIFTTRIEELRKEELVYLTKRKYLDAWCVYFWATTSPMMCLLTFGGMYLLGQPLTASVVFTSVALLNLLIGPLNAFPWVLNGLAEAWVSLKRVQELIDLGNVDFSKYYSPVVRNVNTISGEHEHSVVLRIKGGKFSYEHERDKSGERLNIDEVKDFILENVNIEISNGELICIDSSTGSGKSALINAILGNMKKLKGEIAVNDLNTGFGYVSQTTWLQRGTIRENIIWGAVYDETRYQNVIDCCALREDIDKLGGHSVGIGENGRTLSGGQRVRVSLARALYQNKSFYILDDILSALDAHVASYIIKNCILGFLSKKTRIIVTQNKTLLDHANQIINIENGNVSCIEGYRYDESDFSDDEIDFPSLPRRTPTPPNSDDRISIDSCLMEETKESGNVKISVIACYLKAMGGPLGFFVLLSVILMQASRNLTDGWLANWVSAQTIAPENLTKITNETLDTNFYMEAYAALAFVNSILTFIRSFIFAYAGLKAAKIVHEKLLNSVFSTKLQFFDVTPLGRILNRFSSDTYTIDDSLPFILNILLAQLFGLLGSIGISLYALPWLAIVILPMCPIYLNLQSKYRNASRDIKRLASNALSPLYAHFTETLQGLTTIRAMRAAMRFKEEFSHKLEQSIRSQISASAASCWLALRLQLLGAILVGGAGICTAITSAHSSAPGMVGLAISYALSVSGLLGGVLNAFSETEQEMIAVERVGEYLDLPPEPNADGTIDPPFGWPFQGVVRFKNVYMCYRQHLAPALNGISFESTSYERIGICGRTGAGKTSIVNALLRVSEITKGDIIIDNVNIKALPLNVLRNRVASVAQEPFLWSGTVRDNLDPRSLYLDSEIWNAITHCLSSPLVQSLGGLYGRIESGGSNLSAGQKQLLCLTRCLLKSAKIILIDEGTANLDNESELAIQIVLRHAFKTSTVFIIAHRLYGLQNTDRILMIKDGNLVEVGNFNQLAKDENSYLHQMLEEQK